MNIINTITKGMALELHNSFKLLHNSDRGTFYNLFNDIKPLEYKESLKLFLDSNICYLNEDGYLISNFRITNIYDLFIISDTQNYIGNDRVWYPLDDESILFAKNLGNCKDKSILDVGCGSGVLSIMASKKGARKVIALDLSARALSITKLNCLVNSVDNIELVQGKLDEYQFHDKFDYILINPPFVPMPEGTNYLWSGYGGKDGLSVVHALFNNIDKISHSQTSLSIISMSPGSKFISELEKMFITKFGDKDYSLNIIDVYGKVAPISVATELFKSENKAIEWCQWLDESGYTHMHYLLIHAFPAQYYHYNRYNLYPILAETNETGSWEAMYRVIANSKNHAK